MLIEENYTILGSDKVLDTGSKKPVLVTSADFESEPYLLTSFALKPVGINLSAEQICAEALSVRVAQAAKLNVPSAIILRLDSDSAQIASRPLRKIDSGFAFGSQFIDDAVMVKDIDDIHPVDALNIYFFDFLTQNRDRLIYNPNLLLARKGIYVIDHEQCFDFAIRGGKPDGPGQLLTSAAMNSHTFARLAAREINKTTDKELKNRLLSLADCLKASLVNDVQHYCSSRIESNFDWNAVVKHGLSIKQNVDTNVKAFRSAF